MKPTLLQSMICLSLWALATLPKSSSVEAAEKDSFRQAYFMEHRHSYLAVEKIAELMAHDFEGCALSCLRYHNCFSINMATKPSDASGHLYCELLGTDKYNASDNFTVNPNFHHYSIETPCSRNPCENGGTCIPKYDTGGSACLCTDWFIGEYCEKELPLECRNYIPLSGADRLTSIGSTMAKTLCDDSLPKAWYRFTGSSGVKIPETFPPDNRCNTHAVGWLNGKHPGVSEGVVTRQVCFSYSGNPCSWTTNIRVRNCVSFYLYELVPAPRCHLGYCTEG